MFSACASLPGGGCRSHWSDSCGSDFSCSTKPVLHRRLHDSLSSALSQSLQQKSWILHFSSRLSAEPKGPGFPSCCSGFQPPVHFLPQKFPYFGPSAGFRPSPPKSNGPSSSPHASTRLTGSWTQYPYQSLSPPFAPRGSSAVTGLRRPGPVRWPGRGRYCRYTKPPMVHAMSIAAETITE